MKYTEIRNVRVTFTEIIDFIFDNDRFDIEDLDALVEEHNGCCLNGDSLANFFDDIYSTLYSIASDYDASHNDDEE